MPDARISELPLAAFPADTDLAPLVQFNGAACKRIKDSTVANPVNIEVRVVRPR